MPEKYRLETKSRAGMRQARNASETSTSRTWLSMNPETPNVVVYDSLLTTIVSSALRPPPRIQLDNFPCFNLLRRLASGPS